MHSVPKSASLAELALPNGDHWVHFRVEGDLISYEVAGSPSGGEAEPMPRRAVGFVQKWGESALRVEDAADSWLTHINEKHLR